MTAVAERAGMSGAATHEERSDAGAASIARRVGLIALVFGVSYLVLVVAPPFMSDPFGATLLRFGDVLDFATPLVLIPAHWLLFRAAAPKAPSVLAIAAFMLLAVAWVQGQAMHLAANAISHLVTEPGDPQTLVVYLDEELSHQIWHGAMIGLAALSMRRAWSAAPASVRGGTRAAVALGGLLFGVTFFMMVVEGVTWPFGLPAAVILLVIGVVNTRARPMSRPVVGFFVVSFAAALALSATWAALHGWELVEFSKVFGF